MAIAVDLDGTLAEYHGWNGPNHVGQPIIPMMERVIEWLNKGTEVCIFTARIYEDPVALTGVRGWLVEQARVFECPAIAELEITNIKQPKFTEFWDDRAIPVHKNTGEINYGQEETV